MLEKILPLIIALALLQVFMRYMRRKKPEKQSDWKNFDYKKRIDDLMKISNYDEGINAGKALQDRIKANLATPELYGSIPDDRRDVRRSLNLVIDAVTEGVKAKTGTRPEVMRYSDPDKMFDEIVVIAEKHKIK